MKRFRAFLLLLLGLALPEGQAAPASRLWEYWLPHQPQDTRMVDHAAWTAFLDRYVVPADIARIRYAAVTPTDRALLDRYIQDLAAQPVRQLNRNEQRALWINLYNALTVRVVLEHYPVDSIRAIRISPGLFAAGPWGKKLLQIDGETVSLDDIEHRILRPIWRDPRLHYALNCASLGCPDLQRVAFTAENAETLLDHSARIFINHPRAVRPAAGGIEVSSIYVWFREDFGSGESGMLEHLSRYAEPTLKGILSARPRIVADHYDWALNDLGR